MQLGPDEEFVQPRLRPDNPPPKYPAELIPLRLGPHTVSLRVTFDEQGAAWRVEPSPIAESTDDPYRSAFENALKETLMRWKCQPPRIRKFRPGPDSDGDGKPDFRIMTAQRTLKTFFDLSFTFEVVNGQPVVRSASPK